MYMFVHLCLCVLKTTLSLSLRDGLRRIFLLLRLAFLIAAAPAWTSRAHARLVCKGHSRSSRRIRILGAALGIQKPILGMRSSILGMASHDLSNTETTILGATPRAILGIDGHPHEGFSFAPASSERFFKNRGQEESNFQCNRDVRHRKITSMPEFLM